MKKIINITNLNTNEISSIGAGLSIPQDNAVMRLAQSTVSGIKYNTAFLVDIVKTAPVNNIIIPAVSFISSAIICIANKGRYSRESKKLSAHFEKLLSLSLQ